MTISRSVNWPTRAGLNRPWSRAARTRDCRNRTSHCIRQMAFSVALLGIAYIAAAIGPAAANNAISGVTLSRPFFNPSLKQTITISFQIARQGSLDLRILDRDGFLVRTLASGRASEPGPISIDWDGRDDIGNIVADEAYSLKIDLRSDGPASSYFPADEVIKETKAETTFYDRQQGTLGYQLAGPVFGQFGWWNPLPDFWPFNNQPLLFSYTMPVLNPPRPTRSWLLFTPNEGSVWYPGMAKISMCATPGNFCLLGGIYQEPGPHVVRWLGLDLTKMIRTDIKAMVLMVTAESNDGNIIQVLGSQPVISSLQVKPAYFRPGYGNLDISLTASSFQSSSLTVNYKVERLEFAGPLKSATILAQPAGAITLQWDGKSDSGFLVAEGSYLLTVTVTDALGSVAAEQALITIGY